MPVAPVGAACSGRLEPQLQGCHTGAAEEEDGARPTGTQPGPGPLSGQEPGQRPARSGAAGPCGLDCRP